MSTTEQKLMTLIKLFCLWQPLWNASHLKRPSLMHYWKDVPICYLQFRFSSHTGICSSISCLAHFPETCCKASSDSLHENQLECFLTIQIPQSCSSLGPSKSNLWIYWRLLRWGRAVWGESGMVFSIRGYFCHQLLPARWVGYIPSSSILPLTTLS